MTFMWFGILGAVQARRTDDDPVAVGGPRVRSLLALLLVDAGRVVTTERLVDGLYGDAPPVGAANALQSQVSRLRRGLQDEGGIVELHPAGYRLAVDPEQVDVYRFERLAQDGRRALNAGEHARAAILLREALGLWRGPALSDVIDTPFVRTQQARLEEGRIAAFEDHTEAQLSLGEFREVLSGLQELAAAHPLRERLQAQLIRALYGTSRQAEALAVYEETRRALADELGADPSPELAAVHLAVLRAEPSLSSPPEQTPPRLRLPAQLTSFVGRDDDLKRVGKLLGTGRLVTLIGPGGAGKTRLAIESGEREPDEVCFVDLAPVVDDAEVPQAAISALGLRESGILGSDASGPRPAADRLVSALKDRRTLLILDNCEHVIVAAARLAHLLLGACPGLRILATSREALGITGETLCPMSPLTLPPAGTPPTETLHYSAVRLFADRATAARPDFEVTAGNADLVLRICRALDGLPLAIELAAARLRSMQVADVAARLDDRFRLLSRGDRTAAPRHQTLRAVVEWSWDLLATDEQVLAGRLTVFNGGADPEMASRICGLPRPEVEDLIADLVDKSLIEDVDGRYRMLDTIRVFCGERLAEAGEQDRIRRAHAEAFLELAEAADPHLRRADQLEWLARLTAEHGNLQAALRWAVHADQTLALRLLAALSWYWWVRGLRGEAAPLALELLQSIGLEPPSGLVEEYVLCVLNAASFTSDPAKPAPTPASTSDPAKPAPTPASGTGTGGTDLRRYLEVAESFVDGLEGPPRLPFMLVLWAMAVPIPAADSATWDRQQKVLGDDPWMRALGEFTTGYQYLFRGEPATAGPRFSAALEGFRALGDRWGTANVLDAMAELAGRNGDLRGSIALIDEALDLVGQLGAVEDTADLLCRRADRLVRSGEPGVAQADYERAAELAGAAGASVTLARAHCGSGELARLRGDLAAARRLYEMALGEAATEWMNATETRARALVALGRIAAAEGDAAMARSEFMHALPAARDTPYLSSIADVLEGLADLPLLEDDGDLAAVLLGAAAALRGTPAPADPDVERIIARARALVGDAGFEAAHARGASMTAEEALVLAGA
jgi:predicted ATPase/DNA-binding SARP family transcriptional activator